MNTIHVWQCFDFVIELAILAASVQCPGQGAHGIELGERVTQRGVGG